MTTTDTAVLDAKPEPGTPGSDFAASSRRIARAGLLDRRPGYYVVRITAVGALFTGAWAAFFAIGDSWWQLLVAALLAVAFAQIALVAHDLAHRQVFRTRRPSEIAGLLAGNLAVGMSYGWWMDKHTRHHANPNHEELDPDVAPEILVWSTDQARASRGLPRFIGRWQAYLFAWAGCSWCSRPGRRSSSSPYGTSMSLFAPIALTSKHRVEPPLVPGQEVWVGRVGQGLGGPGRSPEGTTPRRHRLPHQRSGHHRQRRNRR